MAQQGGGGCGAVADEIESILDLTEMVLSKFGFDKYEINLSTRPDKSIGGDEVWDLATEALVTALNRKGWEYMVDEGGGAFYGPKIDLKIQRFKLEYVASDGTKQRPIMIHRAIFGSIERFFGILVENFAGEFPLWLAPEQLRLLPINDAALPFCNDVAKKMRGSGLRVEVDGAAERLQRKIRNAEIAKIPLTAVVGDKEVETGSLAVRQRFVGDLGSMSVAEVQDAMLRAVQTAGDFTKD